MANSEDYTVVWAGVHHRLQNSDIKEARREADPLIHRAQAVGLDHWFDTFDTTPEGEPVFSLLIGLKIDILGYKEGRTQLSLSADALVARFSTVNAALGEAGLPGEAQLHVCLRIED